MSDEVSIPLANPVKQNSGQTTMAQNSSVSIPLANPVKQNKGGIVGAFVYGEVSIPLANPVKQNK